MTNEELIRKFLTDEENENACGYYDPEIAKFLNEFLTWWSANAWTNPGKLDLTGKPFDGGMGCEYKNTKFFAEGQMFILPTKYVAPENKTVFDEISEKVFKMLSQNYQKFDEDLHYKPIETVGKMLQASLIKTIYSKMAENGYAYELVLNSNVEGNKIHASGYIQWYQGSEKRTQEQFDEDFRTIYLKLIESEEQK